MNAKQLYIEILGNLDISDYLDEFPVEGEHGSKMHEQNIEKLRKWARSEFDRGVMQEKMRQKIAEKSKNLSLKVKATEKTIIVRYNCLMCGNDMFAPCSTCQSCISCCICDG